MIPSCPCSRGTPPGDEITYYLIRTKPLFASNRLHAFTPRRRQKIQIPGRKEHLFLKALAQELRRCQVNRIVGSKGLRFRQFRSLSNQSPCDFKQDVAFPIGIEFSPEPPIINC